MEEVIVETIRFPFIYLNNIDINCIACLVRIRNIFNFANL